MYPPPPYPPCPGPYPTYAPHFRPYSFPCPWNGIPPNLPLRPPPPMGSQALVSSAPRPPRQRNPFIPPPPPLVPMPPPGYSRYPPQWCPPYIPPDRSYLHRRDPRVDVDYYNTGREWWPERTRRREQPRQLAGHHRHIKTTSRPSTPNPSQIRLRKKVGAGSTRS
ncbi:hypothetical protein GGR51DRAFT_38051 [Nemania sp. FL0031]|nr:hypothetical protein GGR51DRAFT_38051 [Nemania sp. FL0031]